MCLFSDRPSRRSHKAIVCYKVVYQDKSNNLFTPVLKEPFPYPKNILEKLGIKKVYFKATGKNEVKDNYSGVLVGSGFIHTLTTYRDAIRYIEIMGDCIHKDYTFRIYKCEIPANTEYFTSCDFSQYCSKQIRVIHRLPIRIWSTKK